MKKIPPRILGVDDDRIWLDQLELIFEDSATLVKSPDIDHATQALSLIHI